MRRFAVPTIAAALIAVVAIVLKTLDGYGSSAEASTDYSNWPPSAQTIHAAVARGQSEQDRCDTFASLFKKQFRDHNPPIAVGVKFEAGSNPMLMFPARMEPWTIDRIALMAWQEARDDLGKPYDFDLFHTYIGLPRVKIGQLRTGPSADLILIDYLAWKTPVPLMLPHRVLPMHRSAPLRQQPAPMGQAMVKPPGLP